MVARGYEAGRGSAGLLLACLIQRPDHQPAPAAAAASRLIQPRQREPPHHPYRREGAPQQARLSSRCVRSGDRSPACSAIVHLLRLASPPASAPRYFPACSHSSGRLKHGLSSSRRFRAASRAPILAAAAASVFVVFTNHMIARRLHRHQTGANQDIPDHNPEWLLPY